MRELLTIRPDAVLAARQLQPSFAAMTPDVIKSVDNRVSDGLATALFFTDPMELREMYKFSFAVLHDDMTLYRSQDFPAELFEGDIDGDNHEKN